VSITAKPTVIVTGISGNLGSRLHRLLENFQVVGIDLVPPQTDLPLRFEQIDLGRESACRQLVRIIKETRARAVVHLAFVVDPMQSGILDLERMWQINVAGTARVMEAITERNRQGGEIDTFVCLGSASVYGPETPGPVKEEHPLGAHTLPYAVHKREADDVVRFRAATLGDCATYLLRPHVFAGATVNNYMTAMIRGTPTGKSKRAARMRAEQKRLPLLMPGIRTLEKRTQFVHVDDVARLIAYILRHPHAEENELTILNVAGRGDPITLGAAAQIAGARIKNVRYRWILKRLLRLSWRFGISSVPPEALPYIVGSWTVDTSRLKRFLGSDYDTVIKHSVTAALEDTLRADASVPAAAAHIS
jgi:nucleoside-diphosphate-sugar epimerase